MGSAGKRHAQGVAGGAQATLDEFDDVVAFGKGDFHLQLGELRLPVGAQVLVPEAAAELIITLDAAGHDELAVHLCGLRQRVPGIVAPLTDDSELVRTATGPLGEQRGLNLKEAAVVEVLAPSTQDSVPGTQHRQHLRVPELEISVLRAQSGRRVPSRRCGERHPLALADHRNLCALQAWAAFSVFFFVAVALDGDDVLGTQFAQARRDGTRRGAAVNVAQTAAVT